MEGVSSYFNLVASGQFIRTVTVFRRQVLGWGVVLIERGFRDIYRLDLIMINIVRTP